MKRSLDRACVCLLLPVLVAAGCASPRVEPPAISAADAGQQAIAAYDKNGDGLLDANEINGCPALRNARRQIDTNGDGKLSADEIAARIATHQQSRIGRMTIGCVVTESGKPLAGVAVRLMPEAFLGPNVKSASGVSDKHGNVELKIEGDDLPGVACGFYRVEVSKKGASGSELLPSSFNSRTTLGQEVAPSLREPLTIRLP